MIELKIDPEFRDKIPPLTDAEFEQLKENILADDEVYEPICVWNGTIVDGHNRWKIIQEHPEIPYRIREMDFADKWEAFEWMYRKQLGRRNLTDEQKTYMIGKMYEARKNTQGGNRGTAIDPETGRFTANGQNVHLRERREQRNGTAGQIGKEFEIDGRTVRRAEQFAKGVDKADEVVPGFKEQVLSGELNVPKKDIAEILNMESDEKVKAAVEVIRNPKTKPFHSPNLPKKERSKMSEEDREIADRVNRIVEIQKDSNRDTSITIDDMAELIGEDGKDYVSSLRNTLTVRSTLLVGENRKVIADVIENIIKEISKVKELLQ